MKSVDPRKLGRRKARLRKRIKSHLTNYASLAKLVEVFNRRFDEGHMHPFGIGAFLLGGDPCAYCGDPDARTWDHIDAAAQGGHALAANLTRACTRCNKSKYSTPLLLYLVQRAHRRKRTGKPHMR